MRAAPVRAGAWGGAAVRAGALAGHGRLQLWPGPWAGNADFAIAIRTALMRDGTAYVQAGSGVVADSNGPYEHTEATNKARTVLNAIAAAETLKAP